jgi:hypothetical protein
MGAHVARQIEELLDGEVGGWNPFEDLLTGRVGRLGRASVLADQGLDRRPVDDVERIERAATSSATFVAWSCCRDLSLVPQSRGLTRSSANATAAQDPNQAVVYRRPTMACPWRSIRLVEIREIFERTATWAYLKGSAARTVVRRFI